MIDKIFSLVEQLFEGLSSSLSALIQLALIGLAIYIFIKIFIWALKNKGEFAFILFVNIPTALILISGGLVLIGDFFALLMNGEFLPGTYAVTNFLGNFLGFESSWAAVFFGLLFWCTTLAFMLYQDKSQLQEKLFKK